MVCASRASPRLVDRFRPIGTPAAEDEPRSDRPSAESAVDLQCAKDVSVCLESPTLVRESAKESDVHMYYMPAQQVHLCVVTAPANDDERFVVTTYFTGTIKQGKELWKS